MTEEDLIESVPPAEPAWRRRVDVALRRPIVAVALLVIGLLVGSLGGYIMGYTNPRELTGLGYYFVPFDGPEFEILGQDPFDVSYGRPPLPALTVDDLRALGEQVNREHGILSAASAIPVLCEMSIGQPGSTALGLVYPSRVFGVEGGRIIELIWSHRDQTSASTSLHTLVFQAQLCPDLLEAQATIRSSGVLNGIGDEYVIFTKQPTAAGGGPEAVYSTIALVRLGADLIEVAFTSDLTAAPDAEDRCLRAAAAAVVRAAGS